MVKNTSDRWAVLIGINGYHESLGRLKYSVNDCRRLAEVLTTGDDAFPDDHVLVLADDEDADRKPTYGNIHSWLASWLAQPDEDDTVLVFFAGHGREMGGKCYLAPGDATLQTIHVTGIPVPYVQELLNRCKARQKILILDACHSGAGRDVSTMAAPMMETLSAGKGIYTLTSCGVDELSHEWDEKEQGVFSYYLAEALSGSCPPDAHGRITAEALYDWTFESVRGWAARKRCSQNPQRFSQGIGAIVIHSVTCERRVLARELPKTRYTESEHVLKSVAPSSEHIPTWREWTAELEREKKYDSSLVLAFHGPCVAFGFLILFAVGQSIPWLAPVASIACLVPGVIIHAYWRSAWRNRYNLAQAELCLMRKNYLQGCAFAVQVGNHGVEAASVINILERLATIAESMGDIVRARQLYHRGIAMGSDYCLAKFKELRDQL
jgi:hypothetical protein